METCKKKNIMFQLGENTGKTDHIKLENNKNDFITEPISVYPSKRINSFITKKVTEYVRVNQILDKMSSLLENEIALEIERAGLELKELKKFQEAIYNYLETDNHIIQTLVLKGSENDSIYRHSLNVAILGAIVGKWLGFSGNDIDSIIYAGILSNFGKLKIDKNIISKKGTLTKNEYNIVKTYPIAGYKFLKENTNIDDEILKAVLMHHEREDGSGYPLGEKGQSISNISKIIAICDVFDAANSNRDYKEKKPPFEALRVIQEEMKNGTLDEEYCCVFLEHIINLYLGQSVILNNGVFAEIVKMNKKFIERPVVYIKEEDKFIDLSLEDKLHIKVLVF